MLRVLVFAVLFKQFYGNESSCSYNSINAKYQDSCRNKEYLGEIFTENVGGEITSDMLLEKLTSVCSNYDEYSKCTRCTAKHVCHEEQDKLKEILEGRWSIFCDDDKPANWLATILEAGFLYNTSCFSSFMETLYPCLPHQRPEDSINDTSLSGLQIEYRNVVQEAFSCSVGGILKNGDVDCGSSWQDILLFNWLYVSSTWGMLFNIDKEEIRSLQMMRC